MIFLLLYGVALARPSIQLLEYYIRLDQYRKECTNRLTPEKKCNGQCLLREKLDKVQEKQIPDGTAPAPAKVSLEDYPFAMIAASACAGGLFGTGEELRYPTTQQSVPPPGFTTDVFHPPSFLL